MLTEGIKYIVNRLKIPEYYKFDWTLEADGLEAIPTKLPSLLMVTTTNGTFYVKREWCKRIRENTSRRIH